MKFFAILISFLISSAAMANPFSSFVGSYKPVTEPDITAEGNITNCNWLGFRELSEVKIYQNSGAYILEIVSYVNNSPLRSFIHLEEYSYTKPNVTNKAKVAGDTNGASYTKTNRSSFSSEIFFWEIRRSDSQLHFQMANRRSRSDGDKFGCNYYVDLVAQ